MPGDKIIEINGSRIYYADDFSVYMSRANNENVDLTILRDGEKIYLEDFPLVLREYEENGQVVTKYGISFGVIPGNFWTRLQYSLYTSLNFVRNVFLGFSDLIAGRAGIKDLSGPCLLYTSRRLPFQWSLLDFSYDLSFLSIVFLTQSASYLSISVSLRVRLTLVIELFAFCEAYLNFDKRTFQVN